MAAQHPQVRACKLWCLAAACVALPALVNLLQRLLRENMEPEVIASNERYTYRIDPTDIITYVSKQWLRFAKENEASELTADHVLGQSIWHFIVGADVQRIYQELFWHLRAKRTELIVPFRCDSPTLVRYMELTIRSPGSGAIEFEGRLLRYEVRAPLAMLSRCARRRTDSIQICSICRRFLFQKEWTEAGALIVRRRLFNAESIPRLEEIVCPDCRNKFP